MKIEGISHPDTKDARRILNEACFESNFLIQQITLPKTDFELAAITVNFMGSVALTMAKGDIGLAEQCGSYITSLFEQVIIPAIKSGHAKTIEA